MKILLVTDTLKGGGKERQFVELAIGLKRAKINFEIIIMDKSIDYPEILALDIHIHYIIRKTRKDLSIFCKFYNLISKIEPNIIQCWDSMTAVYLTPTVIIKRIIFINYMIQFAPKKLELKLKIRCWITFPFSTIVLANSKAGLKSHHAPNNKQKVIYNGYNMSRIKTLITKKHLKDILNIKSNIVVTMVAAFEERKDYETFIASAIEIINVRQDVSFLLIGDGLHYQKLYNSVSDSYRNNVRFLGHQTNVENYINISDICVLCTNDAVHGEGISNSIIEYMVLGKPTIATFGGGTGEIITNDNTGYIIPPKSPSALAERILFLINNPIERVRIGSNAKQLIQQSFTLERMTSDFINLYNTLTSK